MLMLNELENKAADNAQEIVEEFPLMVREGRAVDWIALLKLAYMRGFRHSTEDRLNELSNTAKT